MTNFKPGQTVYDKNGKSFEFHHEHNGVTYAYPLYEFQDGSGEWFDCPSDHLMGISTVFEKPPTHKLEEKLAELDQSIHEKKAEAAAARDESFKARSTLDSEKRLLDRWMEENGMLNRIGKMMAGEDPVMLRLPNHEWSPPEGLGTREVAAMKLMYRHDTKVWRFAVPRGYNRDGHDTLELFDTVEQANAFVSAMFEKLCAQVMRMSNTRPNEVFDEARSYTTPHISKLRGWVKKWPHLEVPQDILEAEEAYAETVRAAAVEAAKERLTELLRSE